jgi:hypothetical protein
MEGGELAALISNGSLYASMEDPRQSEYQSARIEYPDPAARHGEILQDAEPSLTGALETIQYCSPEDNTKERSTYPSVDELVQRMSCEVPASQTVSESGLVTVIQNGADVAAISNVSEREQTAGQPSKTRHAST